MRSPGRRCSSSARTCSAWARSSSAAPTTRCRNWAPRRSSAACSPSRRGITRHLSPACRVIGVEPAAGDDATRSFRQKKLVTIDVPDTIADGARTTSLGKLTFPLVLAYVNEMLTVTDDELLRAMFWLWERMKLVVEPTGALAACALLERRVSSVQGKRVGVILSGGNVDLRWAAETLGSRS